jgi:hypothetical protein
MASFKQAGKSAANNGVPAERAVLECFSPEMPAAQLGRGLGEFLDGFGVTRSNPARASLFERCVQSVTARGTARDPRAVCAVAGRRKYGAGEMARRSAAGRRKNPAAAADAAYKEFHGFDPEVTVKVSKLRHTHDYLAGAGVLKALEVRGVDREIHLIHFNRSLLAFNENMNQLFIEGGDQTINVKEFGYTEPHEVYTLGKVRSFDYETDKRHLGKEGGRAIYHHQFRTTNEGGQVVVVTVKRYPDLIYRELDGQLEFSGGSYTIRREGVDF